MDTLSRLFPGHAGTNFRFCSVLKRWGFTPQRPLKKGYEQRPEEVRAWLDEEYPKVKARAKAEEAEIWWGDETAIKPVSRRGMHFRTLFDRDLSPGFSCV